MEEKQASSELHLSEAIKFKTISNSDPELCDKIEFSKFHEFLNSTYQKIYQELKVEKVGQFNLLYTWKGSDPSLPPIVLMAHMDVVPIEQNTSSDWSYPPFGGKIEEGFIWGRGTLDCKGILISILEAVDLLLKNGFTPKRTIYLAFGQDEEVDGWFGSNLIVDLFEERKIKPISVLDEGGVIIDGKPLMVSTQVATIAIAEKGYLNIKLTATTDGGHSASPPKHTTIGILASAIKKLENHRFKSKIEDITKQTIKALSTKMPGYLKFPLNNLWLFGGLIKFAFSKIDVTNALLRTTIAPTIINGGTKDNVLPQSANVIFNLRVHPIDTIDKILKKIKKIIKEPKISVEIVGESWGATKVSRIDGIGYTTLTKTIGELYPNVLITPLLSIGTTDARHYSRICDDVFRFCPIEANEEDQKRIHGTDERISRENFQKLIKFYTNYIKNASL